MCKIKVKKENGDAYGIGRAFVRNALRIVGGLAFYLYLGMILVVRLDKNKG